MAETAIADCLWQSMKDASAALNMFPRGANGLTPDDVKASPEYRLAKSRYDQAFKTLRMFNASRKDKRR